MDKNTLFILLVSALVIYFFILKKPSERFANCTAYNGRGCPVSSGGGNCPRKKCGFKNANNVKEQKYVEQIMPCDCPK